MYLLDIDDQKLVIIRTDWKFKCRLIFCRKTILNETDIWLNEFEKSTGQRHRMLAMLVWYY